jgi:hypothetical protein
MDDKQASLRFRAVSRRAHAGVAFSDVLIGLVLTVAIIGLLLFLMAKQSDVLNSKQVGGAVPAASSAVCRTNLESVRSLIAAAKAADPSGRCPASLSDVGGVAESMTKCPLSPNEPYWYDSSTGQVHCQHPGHENY